jgi:hypothetical protein
MRIAKLLAVIALLGTMCFAVTRNPIGEWLQPGQDEVVALSAHSGIVAVCYGNVHGQGFTNTIQLYENLGTWRQIATLSVSDTNAGVLSLALTATYLVAGAFDSGSNEGAAFIFAEPANGWQNATETAKLLPSDPVQEGGFGWSVAAYGPTVVVGSPTAGMGAAYVYQEPAAGWVNATETAKLTTTDGQGEVGYSIAVAGSVGGDGSQVLLGAPTNTPAGAAYVFQEPVGGWIDMTQTAELTDKGAKAGSELGWSVAMANNVAAAGAPGDSPEPGYVAVFVKPQGGWADSFNPTAVLTDSAGVQIGYSIGITQAGSQIVACCGTSFRHHRVDLAYLFTEATTGWSNEAVASFKLKVPDPENQTTLDVAITKGFAAVGTFDFANQPSVVTYIFAAQ